MCSHFSVPFISKRFLSMQPTSFFIAAELVSKKLARSNNSTSLQKLYNDEKALPLMLPTNSPHFPLRYRRDMSLSIC